MTPREPTQAELEDLFTGAEQHMIRHPDFEPVTVDEYRRLCARNAYRRVLRQYEPSMIPTDELLDALAAVRPA